jgi:hypothetical protein
MTTPPRAPDTPAEEWELGLSQMREFADRHGHTYVAPDAWFRGFPLGRWAACQRAEFRRNCLDNNRRRRLADIPGWDWCRSTPQWFLGFAHLQVYAAQNGTTQVPRDYRTRDGFRLGQWVNRARSNHRTHGLSAKQDSLLESLQDWSWSIRIGQWERLYAEFRSVAEQHGGCLIPKDLENSAGGNMRRWYNTQRSRFSGMNPVRQQMLRDLPGWEVQDTGEKWEIGLREFRAYVAGHGDGLVSRLHVTDSGYHLGQWVATQRYKHKNAVILLERSARLDAIPEWVWEAATDSWSEGYRNLEKYTRATGHAHPDGKLVLDDGYRLGDWVRRQRQSRQNGELSEDRVALLDTLPGWVWSVRDALWEDGFQHLMEYAEEFGEGCVPYSYISPNKFKLGIWAKSQRARKKENRISRERQVRLSAIPGWRW